MHASAFLRRLRARHVATVVLAWIGLVFGLPWFLAIAFAIRWRFEYSNQEDGLAAIGAGYNSPFVPVALLVPAFIFVFAWRRAKR
jgi:hypothetical protein